MILEHGEQAVSDATAPWNCAHQQTELRTRRIAGGGIQYAHQCLSCGRAVGNAVPHNKIGVLPPMWDETIAALHEERCVQYRLRRAIDREREAAQRREAYQSYLLTPQWRDKRRRVLERERYICQGCRERRAEEVHHLTYERVGRELLFDLVALCSLCHRAAHDDA
jgi:hypothetical protein